MCELSAVGMVCLWPCKWQVRVELFCGWWVCLGVCLGLLGWEARRAASWLLFCSISSRQPQPQPLLVLPDWGRACGQDRPLHLAETF